MQPTKTLPSGFELRSTLDLSKNKLALVLMNVLGLVSLFVFGWLFLKAATWLRPDASWEPLTSLQIVSLLDVLKIILVMAAETVAVVILHEAAHGIFFWVFSGERPHFGLRGAYAYASAPEWYFPRAQYLVIGLAPLVLLSLGGLGLIALLPDAWIVVLWLFMIFNASGAIGDILTVAWLLLQPADTLAQDVGDAISLYILPAKT